MAKKKPPVVQIFTERGDMIAVRAGDDAKQALREYFAETLEPYGYESVRVTGSQAGAILTIRNIDGQMKKYQGAVCS